MCAYTIARTLGWAAAVLIALIGIFFPTSFVAAAELHPGATYVEKCGTVESGVYGYGAGMMSQPRPISTSNERVTHLNIAERCAVIEWDTNMPASTQVIFSEVGEAPTTVNSTIEPSFGYPRGTTQNNSGLGSHKAILMDLEPGKVYSYRLVSRTHPSALPQISDEKTFALPATQQANIPLFTFTVITSPSDTSDSTPNVVAVTPTPPPVKIPTPNTADTTPVEESVGDKTEEPTTTVEDEAEGSDSRVAQEEDANGIIAAATAASSALGSNIFGESTFVERINRAFSFGGTSDSRLDLSPGLGLFAKDKYIVPSLFFLLLLFLLQQLLLPALGMKIERPLMFWMFGVVALAVLAALLGFFFLALVMLALFLVLLAWYLIQSTGDDPKLVRKKSQEASENPKTTS